MWSTSSVMIRGSGVAFLMRAVYSSSSFWGVAVVRGPCANADADAPAASSSASADVRPKRMVLIKESSCSSAGGVYPLDPARPRHQRSILDGQAVAIECDPHGLSSG